MKKFWIQFGAALGGLLVLTCVFILFVDPLFYYHAPVSGIPAYFHNQVYQTAGAAEHFNYDSAIVGSSMTENFRVSWFEEKGMDAIKLSYAGSRTADLRSVLDSVYDSSNDVKYIMLDLNDFQLTTDPKLTYLEKDGTALGDGVLEGPEYLFNSDVWWMAAGRIAEAVTGNEPDVDDAYTWEDAELFSKEAVKASCQEVISLFARQKEEGTLVPADRKEMLAFCEGNIANIVPVFEGHPETQFAVFFPPYSILYWQEVVMQENLDVMLEVYRHAIELLMEYDNVEVFYFQDEEELITDLDSYRDVCHHSPQINRYIFDCMMSGERQISAENIDAYFENMYRIASEYPYETIWE